MPSGQLNSTKVFGLELQSNSYTVREGSLERATNVVISQDNIIKKRRGYALFYEPVRVLKNLVQYKDMLIGFCANKVQVYTQNANGTFASVAELGGETISIASNAKARNVESNGNLYFTTSLGVLKLESTTNNVLKAGVKRALDLNLAAQVYSASETYMTPDSQVGYRVVFGRKDANDNFVIGAPSELLIVSNTVQANNGAVSEGSGVVTFSSSTAHGLAVGDQIYIKNADGTGLPDGVYTTLAGTTGTTINVSEVGTYSTITTLDWGKFYNNKIEYGVPAGLSTENVIQIYRSTPSATAEIPPDESTLQLIDEYNLSSGEITVAFGVYDDQIPDILRGAYLYTNPNTGEPGGIAAANDEPPLCEDLAVYKGHTFYLNVTTKFNLALALITSNTTTMPNNAEFKITGAGARNYIGYSGLAVGNRTVKATGTSVSLLAVTVTYNSHGFSNGDTVAIIQALTSAGVQLTTLPVGNYTVSGATANTFILTAPSLTPATLSTLYFAGTSTAAGKRLFYIDNTSSASVAIDTTARSICKAINRDPSGEAFALYTSGADDVPGKMVWQSRSFTQTVYVNNVTAAIADSFTPSLATTGQAVIATRTDGRGRTFVSKYNEPEAVPFANTFVVGSETIPILRGKTIRDTLIIPKSDGIYRINGDDVSNFSVTALDTTVIVKCKDSVTTLNNTVYAYTDQGIVSINETSVSIVSRQIEPLLTSVVGSSTFSDNTHGVSYESERLYLCTTQNPNSTTSDVVYCYNYLTQAWSTWDTMFYDAYTKPLDNKLYYVSTDNKIFQERKNDNRLDYTDTSYAATVLTVPSVATATLSVVGSTPAVGDVFVIGTVINRIIDVTAGVVTFARATGLTPGTVGTLYKGITSDIITSPLTGGDSSVWKQYSEFQIQFRNLQAISRVVTSFITDSTSGSSSTTWTNVIGSGGWGDLPWGDFPWGLEEGINLQFDTTPSQIARLYVPLAASRGIFIKAEIMHNSAAENMLIQSIAYTTRAYSQRVTR